MSMLREMFESAEEDQFAANRRHARRAELLAEALQFARSHPWVYVDDEVPGVADAPDAVQLAERCAAVEAGSRLCLSESAVRSMAGAAAVARERFPHLWQQIREGFASTRYADAAISQLGLFDAHTDPRVYEVFDRALAEIAMHATIGSFRKKAQKLARRLANVSEEKAHKAAMEDRRVTVEDGGSGMSWLNVYGPTKDVHAVFRMLTSNAKHTAKSERDGRTRDQLRCDAFFRRMFGVGSDSLITTKVFVTVPVDRLAPEAQATVREHTEGREGVDLNCEPLVNGDEPIDDATARQALLDAGAFTRVITDPVTGVILDMDRRSRKVTPAQRAWLVLQHGECTRDGCTRLAVDADIDHFCMYHGPKRGRTNIGNMHPFCDPDHTIKDVTKVRLRRRGDLSVQLQFPTGHRTNQTSRRRLRDILPDDDPPPF